MRAVIWTDVFQSMVLIGGMLAVVIQVSGYLVLKTVVIYQAIDYHRAC